MSLAAASIAGGAGQRPLSRHPQSPLTATSAGARHPVHSRWGFFVAPRGRSPVLPPRLPLRQTAPKLPIVSVAAPAIETPEEKKASEDETFQWTKHWYPIIPLALLEESQWEGYENGVPQIQRQAILGRDIVLWKDASGKWRAVEDRCAHRMSALSLGSVQEDGTLACRYHGWCFNGKGECTRIPQAIDAASEATACASSRSKVQAFPTAEAHGLLWVWPDDGPTAWEDASSVEPVVGKVRGAKTKWGVSDLPVSYISSVQNIVDPSHANFVHEGVKVFGAKFDPAHHRPIDKFKSIRRPSKQGGFQVEYTAPSKDQEGDDQRVEFRPPTLSEIQLNFEPNGMDGHFDIHWVPCRPGMTRSIFGFKVEPPKPAADSEAGFLDKMRSAMKMLGLVLGLIQSKIVPKFLMHIYQQNYLARQDMISTHSEDLAFLRSGKPWQQGVYLPTISDVGVVNFREWLTRFGAGGPKWYGGQSEKEAIENLKYSDLFNKWEQHSKYDPTSRKTLKALGFLDSVLPKFTLCLLVVAGALAAFRTAEPRLALVALIAAVLAMLGQQLVQNMRHRLLTYIPSTGVPEFSMKWVS